MNYQDPPKGWFDFGSHVDTPVPGGALEFSEETDEDGFPLWERPAVTYESLRWSHSRMPLFSGNGESLSTDQILNAAAAHREGRSTWERYLRDVLGYEPSDDDER